jgi:hypothetical protein
MMTSEEADPAGEEEDETYATAPPPAAANEGTSRQSRKVAGPLGRSPALDTLAQAAQAVGLDTEALVNLVADSGALALPPSDGATEQFTIDDLGHHLRTQMSQIAKTDRPAWFGKLATVQQAALVVGLHNAGASNHAIATMFDQSILKVMETQNEYADKIGQNVTNVRLTVIVGQMQLVAEKAQQGAADKKDWSTYWRIQKELVANLQSLGIVDKAIHRVEVMHTLGDREKENVERLAQLRVKQLARQEEIKQISAEVSDAVPEQFTEDESDDL